MGVMYVSDPTPGRHAAGSASWNETLGVGFSLPEAADKADWNVRELGNSPPLVIADQPLDYVRLVAAEQDHRRTRRKHGVA